MELVKVLSQQQRNVRTLSDRVSVTVLEECIKLQIAKATDYQNDVSSVKQADYYRLGVDSIYDMMHTKMLRLKSLMETAKANPDSKPNFEGLEDTAKDLINYSSFFAAWIRGGIDGQDLNRDMFNRLIKPEPKTTSVAEAVAAYIETGVPPEGTRGLLDAKYPAETVVGQPTGTVYNHDALKAIHDPDHSGLRGVGTTWYKPA
jgi:hypothetical protein